MSEEQFLPDELADAQSDKIEHDEIERDETQRDELEAQLASMALPASRLDRDQLMYRAGYAAAEAHAAREIAECAPPQQAVPDLRGPYNTVGWSLASAAVAATVAVVVVLGWTSPAEIVGKQAPAEGAPAADAHFGGDDTAPSVGSGQSQQEDRTAERRNPRMADSRSKRVRDLDQLIAGDSLLYWRHRALGRQGDFSESWAQSRRPDPSSRVGASTTPAKSHRELLREFLPERDGAGDETGQQPFWRQWGAESQGAAI